MEHLRNLERTLGVQCHLRNAICLTSRAPGRRAGRGELRNKKTAPSGPDFLLTAPVRALVVPVCCERGLYFKNDSLRQNRKHTKRLVHNTQNSRQSHHQHNTVRKMSNVCACECTVLLRVCTRPAQEPRARHGRHTASRGRPLRAPGYRTHGRFELSTPACRARHWSLTRL